MNAMQDKVPKVWPWLILVSRSILFAGFQGLIALVLSSYGTDDLWAESAKWWVIAIVLSDLVGLGLLIYLYRRSGQRFWAVFHIQKQFIKQDGWIMLGFLAAAGVLGMLPNILSAVWLFGDPQAGLEILVQPLPAWAVIFALFSFPILQGIVEIPTYMLYTQPRLEAQGVKPWISVLLTGFFLSAQHVFAPFLPDARFIIYRFIMFLPFAFFVALVVRWRPRLMPYIAVIHALMDLSVAVMLFLVRL